MRRYHGLLIPVILTALAALSGCGGGLVADETTSDYDSLVSQGWTAYNQGNYAEAGRLFIRARAADPLKPEAYLGDAWTLLRRQHPDSASVAFKIGFTYITSLADSVDAICGLSGSYLANGNNSKAASILRDYPVSDLEKGFPLRKHDFLLDSGDLEITQAMALYRLGQYSPAQKADPDNALYHLNRVLDTPYVYTTPQELMAKMNEYLTLSGGGSFQ